MILPLPPHMVPEHGPRGRIKADGLAWPTNFVPMLNPTTIWFCLISSVQSNISPKMSALGRVKTGPWGTVNHHPPPMRHEG